MEPTNYFWKLLAAYLERRQVPYRLVNSYTVKKRREGDQLSRSKDDDRDAFTIADLLRTGKFTQTQLLHGGYAELRQYVGLRDRLQDDIRRQKSRIWHFTGQLFRTNHRVQGSHRSDGLGTAPPAWGCGHDPGPDRCRLHRRRPV